MAEIFWHNLEIAEVAKLQRTNLKEGLSDKEVEVRQREFGKNLLPKKRPLSKLRLFLEQFRSPLIYILIVVGIVVLILENYPHNLIESGFVFVVIIICTLFGFWEELKSSKALKKLKEVLKTKAMVIREGRKLELFQEELVPGDIIVLGPGDKVPADGRIIEGQNLKINEMALTGEWLPAKKKKEALPKDTPLADRDNMVYTGCLVEDGRGKVIITSIGKNTEMGKIVQLVKKAKEEKTPLEKKLAHFSKLIGAVIVAICLLIFLIGVIQGRGLVEMFEMAAAISVGGIPESLPVVMTLVLALGMERLLKRKGLIRKLASVETLGSTSIICADKTKTLTEGKMKVAEVIGNKFLTLKAAALTSEAFIENPDEPREKWRIRGRPTDRALLEAGIGMGIDRKKEFKKKKIAELPFNPINKFAAALYKEEDKQILYVCGAPEKILELSNLTKENKKKWQEKLENLAQKGLRVVASAYKKIANLPKYTTNNTNKIFEKISGEFVNIRDLNFAGLISLKDPLRKEVKEAIQICKDSGLTPVIITGDHKLTALAISQELGLKVKEENIMEGRELDKISDENLAKIVPKIKIFARAEPRHKIKIVRAWQERNQVVAMTGDGINDTPALKQADIGIGLGSGTEAAKEVADLVLLTDGFNIIVRAIEQGRIILDNIRKSISYILADSFTSVILVGFSLALGWPLPILWTQILWNNIVEDTFPAISYVFEPKEKEVMKRGPSSPQAPLLTKEMKVLIFGTGLIDEFLILLLFWILWAKLGFDLDYARTMVFGAICIDTAFVIYCYKNLRKNLWRINPFNNKFLPISSAIVFAAFAAAIYFPPLQTLLHTVSLGMGSWLILILVAIISMSLIEITKWYFISRHLIEK